MDVNKKIIKAGNLEKMGTKVETVDLGAQRRFHARVFKDIPVDEKPVEMEEAAPAELEDDQVEGAEAEAEDQEQVKIERFHDEQGELIGLRITCKCGEVVDLEFTHD